MSFDNLHLDSDEHVIYEVRKHWIIFLGVAVGFLFAGLVPLILITIVSVVYPESMSISLPGNGTALFSFFYLLWILTLWVIFFVDWTKYYLDVWYVTEKRIIAIEQKYMFDREISNLRFDKIQDITVNVDGFMSTMLDFGNIRVQTASEDNREFLIKTVRHPDKVRKIIFDRQNKINESESNSQQGV